MRGCTSTGQAWRWTRQSNVNRKESIDSRVCLKSVHTSVKLKGWFTCMKYECNELLFTAISPECPWHLLPRANSVCRHGIDSWNRRGKQGKVWRGSLCNVWLVDISDCVEMMLCALEASSILLNYRLAIVQQL